MKRTPILILCLGGQGASVLARTFKKCGMFIGNENTYWKEEFEVPHAEQGTVTELMAAFNSPNLTEVVRLNTLFKLRIIIRSYKEEAERLNLKFYGFKTTSGICSNKWGKGVGQVYEEEWPDALYFGVIREPDINAHADKGWNSVWTGRKGMVERGGIFVPFPDAWNDNSIKDIVEAIGLTWDDGVGEIFLEPAEEKSWICTEEDKERYFKKFPDEKEQREYLMKRSLENLERLKQSVKERI
jgi:hypothetical protein